MGARLPLRHGPDGLLGRPPVFLFQTQGLALSREWLAPRARLHGMRWWAGAIAATIFAATLSGADDLPKPEESEGLEIDPPLLIQNRGADGLPIIPAAAQSPDLAKLENDLTRAKKSAAAAERLFKGGIISKVEAEERALRVVRLQAALASAQLEDAKTKADAVEHSELIAQAEQAAERAAEERHRAELEVALRNLQRQQKLLALGSGRKADVNRAEKKLAELQHGQD